MTHHRCSEILIRRIQYLQKLFIAANLTLQGHLRTIKYQLTEEYWRHIIVVVVLWPQLGPHGGSVSTRDCKPLLEKEEMN